MQRVVDTYQCEWRTTVEGAAIHSESRNDIRALDDIMPNTGVGALIGREQIAVVRFGDDQVFAVSNFDPFSKAMVNFCAIVRDANGPPKIASPVYKQSFDLRAGQCGDDPEVRIAVFAARVVAGRVQVRAP